MLLIGGALSVLFGILVLVWPCTGLITIIWIIGIWAIVWGITQIVLGVQLRKAAPHVRGRRFADILNAVLWLTG